MEERFYMLKLEREPQASQIYRFSKYRSDAICIQSVLKNMYNGKCTYHTEYNRMLKMGLDKLYGCNRLIELNFFLLALDQQIDQIIVKINDLKWICGYGNKYPSYADFKSKVLIPSINRLRFEHKIVVRLFKEDAIHLLILFEKNG
jgi:hypothetical protein